ncbi:MAG: SRPBCC domain-containing protein [Casimicrobiaceae bacterium]
MKPSGAGTELLLTHQRFADTEARDKHQHGWTGCLDRLGRHLVR